MSRRSRLVFAANSLSSRAKAHYDITREFRIPVEGLAMTSCLRIVAGFCAASLIATSAAGQAPAPAKRVQPPPTRAPRPAAPRQVAQNYSEPDSILAHRSWSYRSNDTYGFRNPGGVGRVAEYYPPGDRFQNDNPRHVTAQIGNGGQPDRNEQLQAQMVGVQRYNALQSHIDRYGAPFGFGYGFGPVFGFGFR
jgi:hypothetical protein